MSHSAMSHQWQHFDSAAAGVVCGVVVDRFHCARLIVVISDLAQAATACSAPVHDACMRVLHVVSVVAG